ncbi:uncharacterized protein LOC126633809 [Malus sylvestris]|uniref:uncharacterized protein LOC126633809 n=1 Tax=Malus sylvestris TaxID=3752 RepID=UPI0021AC8B7F|nr:uncharacterized protein LOC126633809 [Malus sylvestris]
MKKQPIRFLTPYQPANKLHIRVCRIWVTKSIGDNPQAISLDCVFVDKDGDVVHRTMNGRDIQFFLDHLTVDNAYEISKFRVVHNKRSSKVFPHAAMIELNRKITIFPVHNTSQELPRHWFNLIELNQLHRRIDNDVELTDVFGCLTAVQLTEKITIQNTRVAKKRNFNRQNIRDKTVRITLWVETATGFENSGIQATLPPVYGTIISKSGRANIDVTAYSKIFGAAGIAVLILAVGILVWDIYSADNPLQTAARDAVTTAAAIGGAMIGEVVGVALASMVTGNALLVLMAGITS